MTTYTASEVIAISGLAPVQSSASLIDNVGGARASSAIICPKTNPVDYTFVDGSTPSAIDSIRQAINVPFTIYGYDNIKNAVYFNVNGNSGSLYIQYSYGN